jgi:hypothetical protein
MNSDEMTFTPAPETVGEDASERREGLYNGDRGLLPLDTRRALVQLLAGPFVDVRRHSLLWSVVLRDEEILKSRLAELFLELVVDRDAQVAFTRQADTGELETPTLLRRAQLTFMDSALLLHLRHLLTRAESNGERAAVSENEMMEHMALYERSANTDRAGFQKRVSASFEKMKKHGILQKIRGGEDRYEVSPALKLLFSPEVIGSLTGLYQRMAAEGANTPEIHANPETEDEE